VIEALAQRMTRPSQSTRRNPKSHVLHSTQAPRSSTTSQRFVLISTSPMLSHAPAPDCVDALTRHARNDASSAAVADIMHEVTHSLRASINMAERRGVKRESIVIDPGIGFGKSPGTKPRTDRKTGQLIAAFPDYPSNDRHLSQILHRPHSRRRIRHPRSCF
jgi:hypothetical protein